MRSASVAEMVLLDNFLRTLHGEIQCEYMLKMIILHEIILYTGVS